MSKNVLVGAKVLLFINGVLYAKVSDFTWSSETPRRAIHALDALEPFELAPLATRVTGTIAIYRIISDGGAEGAGMAAPRADLSLEKYFSILLVDKLTDSTIFAADQCSVLSQAWQVPGRGYMRGTITFEALTWNNEVRAQHG